MLRAPNTVVQVMQVNIETTAKVRSHAIAGGRRGEEQRRTRTSKTTNIDDDERRRESFRVRPALDFTDDDIETRL